ncbi:isochorismate synthase [Sporolactobacillus vineae]|uniref:isochorismate synthase n=1 Tax=Sporolactobacillus vineae TaxID=444463 RepID=UPI0002DA4B16|nr:isochorismate synthase [Sporolactobacillus vineae]
MDTEYETTCLKINGSGRKNSEERLISLTIGVEEMDPLIFYQTGQPLAAGKRFYWQSPSGDLTLTGIGAAAVIHAGSGRDRMLRVQKQWSQLTEQAVQYGDASLPGTGPILFGGFSFTPGKETDRLWGHFVNGLFLLPRLMLTVNHGQTFLSVNALHQPGESLEQLVRMMKQQAEDVQQMPSGRAVEQRPELLQADQQAPDEWLTLVNRAVAALKAKQMDKVVLARTLRLHFNGHPDAAAVLRRLKAQQAGDFIYCLEASGDYFIGASPERLVRKQDSMIESMCLAGSAARGQTKEADDLLGDRLLHDAKNRREHQYVVTMIRQALGKLCRSLTVPDHPVLMKNRDIQHLFTPVSGRSGDNLSVLHFVEQLHPTPALGGLPRDRAVRWISENEPFSRGIYGAPVGWCDRHGNGDFSVGIRSGLVQGHQAVLFAGCGILEASVPEQEYKETKTKFRPMLNGLGVDTDGAQ